MTQTYYVDSIDGDDARAGTSEATAWQKLTRLPAALLPGDTVLLRRGGGRGGVGGDGDTMMSAIARTLAAALRGEETA